MRKKYEWQKFRMMMNCRNMNGVGMMLVMLLQTNAPTIDAVPIGYIMQRADALIETNVYGAKVLYGLVMIWKGEEQNDDI